MNSDLLHNKREIEMTFSIHQIKNGEDLGSVSRSVTFRTAQEAELAANFYRKQWVHSAFVVVGA